MALHLNLLHEEIAEHRQRQRDPLKLGTIALAFLGVLMLLFYAFKAYQMLEINNRLKIAQANWSKVEGKVNAAKKRTAELNATVGTTKVLDSMVEGRFYWAPLLQYLSLCVAPNAQITSINGAIPDDHKTVTLTIEGMAAGREPRAAAEDLRQLLSEQLSAHYGEVKVDFKTLEDLDTLANVSGVNMALARYVIGVTFTPVKETTPTPAPTARTPKQ